MKRRAFVGHMAVAAVAPAAAIAQTPWPTKTVNVVVGYAPGGGVDAVMRSIMPALSSRLGQQFVVDNRPGASGIVAAQYVAKATPDGYTLFGTDAGALVLNEALFSSLPYNPQRDFAPISLVIRALLAIVANPGFAANDLRELKEIATREKITYASPGLGTLHHLAFELLKRQLGFDAEAVPYKGAAPATQDVISGQVPVMALDMVVGLPQIRAGKLKTLAMLTAARFPSLPDVPTATEQGVADVIVYPWVGLAAPRATPGSTIARLSADIRSVIAQADIADRFVKLGMESIASTPDEFATFIDSETKRWNPLIKKLGIRLG
jgi:tripartite-type tricarboxylate transporter receptor subunit TctC